MEKERETCSMNNSKLIFLFCFIIFPLLSCISKNNQKTNGLLLVSKESYEKDKKQISDRFIEKVEYFRLYYRYDLHNIYNVSEEFLKRIDRERKEYYQKNPYAETDPSNFFEPYANRFDLAKNTYVASPLPTKDQIRVTTDTIIYSPNKLICFAFLVVKGEYSHINSLENPMDIGREYDAKAIIGIKSNEKDSFEIYPADQFSTIGFENYKSAVNELKRMFFNNLKRVGSGGSPIYLNFPFKQNVGDDNFFEKSSYFIKDKRTNLFYFQLYKPFDNDTLKEYPSRQIHDIMRFRQWTTFGLTKKINSIKDD